MDSTRLEYAPTGHGKHILGRTKAVGFRNTDGKPDDAKEKIYHHESDGKLEDTRVHSRGEIIDSNRQKEKALRNSPYKSSPFDVSIVDTTWEIYLPYCELGNNVIGGGLK
jgi:hypothetical protein